MPLARSHAAEAPALFAEAGALDRFPADARAVFGTTFVPTFEKANMTQKATSGTLIVIPKARQLWQLYPADLLTSPTAATGIVVRDLDTLEIKNTFKLPVEARRSTISPDGGGEWAHAVDDTATRMWLLDLNFKSVFEIDLRTFAFKQRFLPASVAPTGIPIPIGGMAYDRYTDDLLILYSGPGAASAANSQVFLLSLDVSVPPPPSFPAADLAKMYRLRSCSGPVTSTDAGSDTQNWEMLVTEEYLYVPCQRAGHTVVVVRLTRPNGNSDPNHPEDATAGPVYGDNVMVDQKSGRMFVATINREVWAFETSTMSFVGVVATGPEGANRKTGYGLDTESGRVFFQSPTFGLGVAEGRFFPIPQARTMPRLVTGQERIWSDPATKRIFVLEGNGAERNKARSYRIYTTGTAPVPPALPDPDRNTADVAEREGVTESRFNASGSGYGTRILLAKGYATVVPAPTAGVLAPTFDVFDTFKTRCGYTDRDVFAGRVAKAEYDTGSTAAQAAAASVDNATKQDLDQPSRCQIGLSDGDRWPYKPAACASSEGNVPAEPARGAPDDLGPSEATCPAPGGKLEAFAETQLTGMVEVDRSWTRTTVQRLSGGGVRAAVEAVAQGVSLGGTIHIGEIRSTAVSSSDGRPKRKDMSTHEITIAHVRFGDTVLCEAACDPVELEQRLNLLAGGRAVFRTGKGANSGRDETLVAGSPRGAQTAVQKSVARQASDRALVGDFTVELPALEMTVFNDNTRWGRARQLYQFAGVASTATYNIVVRPTAIPFDDVGLPEEVPVADAGTTPFGDLVDGFGGSMTTSDVALPVSPVARQGDEGDGGGLAGAMRALARGIRLFFSDPRHALLLLTAWALLGSPAVLARRRRLLGDLRVR